MISAEDYTKIYEYLSKKIGMKFDLLNFEGLEEEDKQLDNMLIDMGLNINDESVYKNIKKDVIWIE